MDEDTKNFLWFVGIAIVISLFFVGITVQETLLPEPPIWVLYLLFVSVLLGSELGYLFVWRVGDDLHSDSKLSLRVNRMFYAFMSKFIWFIGISITIALIIVDIIGAIRTIKFFISLGQDFMIFVGVIALIIAYIWLNSLRYDYEEKKERERIKKEIEEDIRKVEAKKKRKKSKAKKKEKKIK